MILKLTTSFLPKVLNDLNEMTLTNDDPTMYVEENCAAIEFYQLGRSGYKFFPFDK